MKMLVIIEQLLTDFESSYYSQLCHLTDSILLYIFSVSSLSQTLSSSTFSQFRHFHRLYPALHSLSFCSERCQLAISASITRR